MPENSFWLYHAYITHFHSLNRKHNSTDMNVPIQQDSFLYYFLSNLLFSLMHFIFFFCLRNDDICYSVVHCIFCFWCCSFPCTCTSVVERIIRTLIFTYFLFLKIETESLCNGFSLILDGLIILPIIFSFSSDMCCVFIFLTDAA